MSDDFPTDLEIYIILGFLNKVQTINQITAAFHHPEKPHIKVNVRPDFFELKAKLGQFVSVDQICNLLAVPYTQISELVSILKEKGIVSIS